MIDELYNSKEYQEWCKEIEYQQWVDMVNSTDTDGWYRSYSLNCIE